MFTLTFWKDTAERVVRTTAAAVAGSFGVGTGLAGVDWETALSITGGTALGTLVLCLAGGTTGRRGTASFATFLRPAGRHRASTD